MTATGHGLVTIGEGFTSALREPAVNCRSRSFPG
jgi:hypothetical protein